MKGLTGKIRGAQGVLQHFQSCSSEKPGSRVDFSLRGSQRQVPVAGVEVKSALRNLQRRVVFYFRLQCGLIDSVRFIWKTSHNRTIETRLFLTSMLESEKALGGMYALCFGGRIG